MRFKLVETYLIEDIESMKKYYPNIADDVFMDYIELDPTYKGGNNAGKYAKWILALANKGTLDNIGHVKDILTRFDSEKNNLINKDIMKYKSLDELEDMLNDESSYAEKSHRQQVRDRQKARRDADITKEAKLVFSGDGFDVWVPETYAAECKLGAGTRWCTASTESDYYYDYYKRAYGGDYYVLIGENGEKYQFHIESHQFMNKDDESVDMVEFFEDKPSLKAFITPKILKAMGVTEEMLSKPLSVFVDIDDIAKQLSTRDVPAQFIEDVYSEEGYEYFYSDVSDREALSISENDISESNLQKIKNILNTEYNVKVDDVFKDIDLTDYDDIMRSLVVACDSTYDAMGLEMVRNDIDYAIKESAEDLGSTVTFDDSGVRLSILLTPENVANYYFYAEDDVESIDDLVTQSFLEILEKHGIYEPRYGWWDWDADYFNDDLEWRLDDIITSLEA